MNHVATNFLFQQPSDPNSLPPSQYDARNALGLRFLEVGFALTEFNLPDFVRPDEYSVSLSEIAEAFSYDPSKTFRNVTIGVESYSIRHDDQFVESEREPVAVAIPQIDDTIGTRYTFIAPNDSGQALAGAISVNILGKLPGSITFRVGLINPLPNDKNIYNFNAPRTTSAPFWASQFIRSLTVRFYVKASFEPNYIPAIGFPVGGMQHGLRGKIQGVNSVPVPEQGISVSGDGGSATARKVGRNVVFAPSVSNVVSATESVAVESGVAAEDGAYGVDENVVSSSGVGMKRERDTYGGDVDDDDDVGEYDDESTISMNSTQVYGGGGASTVGGGGAAAAAQDTGPITQRRGRLPGFVRFRQKRKVGETEAQYQEYAQAFQLARESGY